MPGVTYPQLDERALNLLRQARERLGSIKAVAEALGYKRPSVSMALAGKYQGDTKHLRARIFEVFADRVLCPHLSRDIPPADCRTFRERPIPTSPLAAVKHWQACRICPLNPAARNAAALVEEPS